MTTSNCWACGGVPPSWADPARGAPAEFSSLRAQKMTGLFGHREGAWRPTVGFSRLILRIRSRSSWAMRGRPPGDQDLQRQ